MYPSAYTTVQHIFDASGSLHGLDTSCTCIFSFHFPFLILSVSHDPRNTSFFQQSLDT